MFLSDQRHHPVNWQDGMKIRSGHFITTEQWLDEKIQDALCINQIGYGLLPPVSGRDTSLQITCTVLPGQEIQVVLLACRAITEGGIRIEYQEQANGGSGIKRIECRHSTKNISGNKLDLYVSVDPDVRIPIGVPDPEESPPRRPYVFPKYQLKLLTAGEAHHPVSELKIGEILLEKETASLSKQYIPPCALITSHPVFVKIYQDWLGLLNELGKNATMVFQRLWSGYAPEGTDTTNRDALQFFTEKIAFFLTDSISRYRLLISQAPPIHFVEYFMRFANIAYVTLECIDNNTRQILMNYFKEWGSGFTPGKFDSALQQILKHEFQQDNPVAFLALVPPFLVPISETYKILHKRNFNKWREGIIHEIRSKT